MIFLGASKSGARAEQEQDASVNEDGIGTRQHLGQDPYNIAEEDPAQSRALDSSLWELDSLRNHYCPQVGF